MPSASAQDPAKGGQENLGQMTKRRDRFSISL